MAERNYYVLCEDNCKFPAMTKEQILTAIQQAVSTGEIKDVDTGFVTRIKEQNSGKALSFWIGTSAEYNAIEAKENNCFYIITDDTTGEDLKQAIEELKKAVYEERKVIPPLAEIVVTVQGGGVVCKNASGEKMTGVQNGTEFRFFISEYGTYSLEGTYNGFSQTKKVEVKAVQQYFETFDYYSDTFAENDWETIIYAIQKNRVPATWKVGDSKDGILIIGMQHDEYSNGTKAPITFMTTGDDTSKPIAEESGDVSDWANSYMRNDVLTETTFHGAAVKPVKKYTYSYIDNAIEITYDRYFLLSEIEMFGTTNNSQAGEGAEYEYFKNGNTNDFSTWLRSSVNTSQFVNVSNGKQYITNAYYSKVYQSAFCI